jgi:hypothetical protein
MTANSIFIQANISTQPGRSYYKKFKPTLSELEEKWQHTFDRFDLEYGNVLFRPGKTITTPELMEPEDE